MYITFNHKEYTHTGILLSHKTELNKATCSNMDGPRDYQWSKSEREIQMPQDIIYMWNLTYNTNESLYKTETGSQT